MPIYEFECNQEHRHEKIFPKPDPPEWHPCPVCDRPAHLVISLPRLNMEFPGQCGASHNFSSMAGGYKPVHKPGDV